MSKSKLPLLKKNIWDSNKLLVERIQNVRPTYCTRGNTTPTQQPILTNTLSDKIVWMQCFSTASTNFKQSVEKIN